MTEPKRKRSPNGRFTANADAEEGIDKRCKCDYPSLDNETNSSNEKIFIINKKIIIRIFAIIASLIIFSPWIIMIIKNQKLIKFVLRMLYDYYSLFTYENEKRKCDVYANKTSSDDLE